MPKPEKIPPCPAVPVGQSRGHEVREYKIDLITPMFGGGVEAGVNDEIFPIRATAIRGQLQFWWRATVGAQYVTLKELRAAQSEIWGSTKRASRVKVRVELIQVSRPSPCARYEKNSGSSGRLRSTPNWNEPFRGTSLPYALFPFQGQLEDGKQSIKQQPASYIPQACFRLTLIHDTSIEFVRDIEPAIWAWINFGGLGSRTRRGCGAITCNQLSPHDADDLKTGWQRYMPQLFTEREWPTLYAAFLTGYEFPKPIDAWENTIALLKNFRQGVGVGRNGESPRDPKRSHWPEPEAIRSVTRQRLKKHQPLTQHEGGLGAAFPRAEFGLPIVFHFKDENPKDLSDRHSDPETTVLYPDKDRDGHDRERMASPLILKPLALQSGKAIPLILRLRTPALTGVDLRLGDNSLVLPSPTVTRDPRLADYKDSPLSIKQHVSEQEKAGVTETGSALDAFLAFAKKNGFQP